MTGLFAITTRGLEEVAAGEIQRLPGVEVLERGYRRVAMHASGPLAALLALRTVDDCFLDLATWRNVPHTRAALTMLAELSRGLDLPRAVSAARSLRSISARPSFAVTVNFVGARNYSSDEAKLQIGSAIQDRLGWVHQLRDDASEVNLRIFIEHETVHVGLRLAAHPLHERTYKRQHRPGSLRPPVAAAMVALSGLSAGQEMLDPCCGSGTLLVEATHAGARCRGGDLDDAAVTAARENAAAAGATVGIERWDACALPLPDASCDHVICNLPWDRQVEVDAGLRDFHEQICREISRILRPNGTATILTIHGDLVHLPGRTRTHAVEISLHGQLPRIICTS